MHILQICPKMPYPATDGGRIAIYEPLRRLAARGHRITLLAPAPAVVDMSALAEMRRHCRLELVPLDTRNHMLPAAINLFSSTPYTVAKYDARPLRKRLRELLAAERYDLVQIENLHMAAYGAIAAEQGLPVVLRQQNVESQLAERYARTQHGLRRLYALIHAAKLRRYEASACARMDVCLAITPDDAERLRALSPTIRVVTVPAGVDLDDFQPRPAGEEAAAIVSVAAMDWPPNSDAIGWFSEQVLPLIRETHPAARLYIVGKNPPPAIQALARLDYVTVTGFVDDVRAYFAKGAVFVVPLRSGGGMRVKILQAMAMGKAIVSTTIGAEGIAAEDGEAICLADTPAAFAGQVSRLLGDAQLRRRIGGCAQRLAAARYSWDSTVDRLEQVYRQIISDKGRAPISESRPQIFT
jgi:polysaccharide biosynthesis protein PslH